MYNYSQMSKPKEYLSSQIKEWLAVKITAAEENQAKACTAGNKQQ